MNRGHRDPSSFIIATAILLFGCLFLILIITLSDRVVFFKLSGRATLVAAATVLAETRTALASPEPVSTPTSTPIFTRPTSTLTPTKSISTPTRIRPTVTPSSTRTPTRTSIPTSKLAFTPTSISKPAFTPIPSPKPTFTPTSTPVLTSTSFLAIVDVEILNFRVGPGTDYDKISRFEKGTKLEILVRNEEGDWLLVRTEEGREGWVAAEYVQTSADLDSIPVAAETPSLPTSTPAESPSPSPTEASTPIESPSPSPTEASTPIESPSPSPTETSTGAETGPLAPP